jgi:hypothetical protein
MNLRKGQEVRIQHESAPVEEEKDHRADGGQPLIPGTPDYPKDNTQVALPTTAMNTGVTREAVPSQGDATVIDMPLVPPPPPSDRKMRFCFLF